MKFICSLCFSQNPPIANAKVQAISSSQPSRPRLESLPIVAQGYIHKASEPSTESNVTSEKSVSSAHPSSYSKVANAGNTCHSLPSLMYEPRPEIKKCDNCTFETVSAEELIVHITDNHKPTCSVCDKTFKSLSLLQAHSTSGHKITCKICNVECSNEIDLETHTNKHHRIECSLCIELFNTGKELETHLQDKHSHKCQSCSHVTNTIENIVT